MCILLRYGIASVLEVNLPIVTLNTITNVRISVGKTIVRGYVVKQTVPPHQPLPLSLEIYRNTRIT